MDDRARLQHPGEQWHAGRHRLGNFQRLIGNGQIRDRFTQIQHITAFAGEKIFVQRGTFFELRAGDPDFAPDIRLHIRRPGAERFAAGAEREAHDEIRRHAKSGHFGNVQRERLVREQQRGPRLCELQFQLPLVLHIIILQSRREQAEHFRFTQRFGAAGNFHGLRAGEIIRAQIGRAGGEQLADLRAVERQTFPERGRITQPHSGQRLGGGKQLRHKHAVVADGRGSLQLDGRRGVVGGYGKPAAVNGDQQGGK